MIRIIPVSARQRQDGYDRRDVMDLQTLLYHPLRLTMSFLLQILRYQPRQAVNNSLQQLILVHNVTTSEDDLAIVNQHYKDHRANLFFCLCPNANQYISGMLPDVQMLVNNDCNLVLGTDSLASNDQLNILSEIRTIQSAFPSISFSQILKWATMNGARALHISDQFGSFEKGKKPGVLNISGDEIRVLI